MISLAIPTKTNLPFKRRCSMCDEGILFRMGDIDGALWCPACRHLVMDSAIEHCLKIFKGDERNYVEQIGPLSDEDIIEIGLQAKRLKERKKD